MEVGGEHAHCVVANPHRAASSPEEQPLQLTVTEQSLRAEVPGGKTSKHNLCRLTDVIVKINGGFIYLCVPAHRYCA